MGKRKRRLERKRERLSRHLTMITGIFSASQNGFGFVSMETDTRSLFIPPHFTGGAIDGDRVEAAVTSPEDPKGPSGKIVRVLERNRSLLVGELLDRWTIRPLERNLPEIRISGGLKGAVRGDWVKVRLLDCGSGFKESLRCSVEEKIGKSATVMGDLLAVSRQYDMPEPYSQEMELTAARITPLEVEREDLTDRFTLTMDPADAHDFDDALSIQDHRTEWEIGVHIADVAVWVRPGTLLDKEARKRGFSSYIPGMFRPMLPLNLTKRISMTPGRASPAHTFLLRIRKKDGKLLSWKRLHSSVRITARLNYDEVQEFLDGKTPEGWDKERIRRVKMLSQAVKMMRSLREKEEKFLQMDLPELRFFCDEQTFRLTGMECRPQRFAEAMVEECMLAANSCAAAELLEKHTPALYRTHGEPDGEKLMEFEAFAETILKHRPGDLSDRENAVKFLAAIPDDHTKTLVLQSFLRCMARAGYSPEPGLHYGLGKMLYSHFTSPIRRYADLFIHQQFLARDLGSRLRSGKTASAVADELIRLERRNDEAFFAATDRLKLHYIREQGIEGSPRMLEGVIVKAAGAGLVCDIPEFALRGFMPACFVSLISRRVKLRPGDVIYLYIDRLDFARGSAILKPVQ